MLQEDEVLKEFLEFADLFSDFKNYNKHLFYLQTDGDVSSYINSFKYLYGSISLPINLHFYCFHTIIKIFLDNIIKGLSLQHKHYLYHLVSDVNPGRVRYIFLRKRILNII